MLDRDEQLRRRIVSDSKVMVGQPCIRGTRLTVKLILNLLAHGATRDEILEEYDRLTPDDIAACLLYAADVFEYAPRELLTASALPSAASTR
jgi:uncharacterized protein (DUF433 family)